MRIIKRFPSEDRASAASAVFDSVIKRNEFHLGFDQLEFHIRDSTISKVQDNSALLCLNYNNPLLQEADRRGTETLIRHELMRLMFKTSFPKPIEDVIIGREMIKRGFGEDLFYMYYSTIVAMKPDSMDEYININIPWITFRGYDEFSSDFLRKSAEKISPRKDARRFFDLLCNLSPKNVKKVSAEYEKLVKKCS